MESENAMTNDEKRKEIQEAVDAADAALKALNNAEIDLRSASGWGIVDLLGGGLLSSLIKQNDMSDAQKHMDEARIAIQKFSEELKDVDQDLDLNLGKDQLVFMTDVLFDNALVDLFVQSSISDAQSKVKQTIKKVETLKKELISMLEEL